MPTLDRRVVRLASLSLAALLIVGACGSSSTPAPAGTTPARPAPPRRPPGPPPRPTARAVRSSSRPSGLNGAPDLEAKLPAKLCGADPAAELRGRAGADASANPMLGALRCPGCRRQRHDRHRRVNHAGHLPVTVFAYQVKGGNTQMFSAILAGMAAGGSQVSLGGKNVTKIDDSGSATYLYIKDDTGNSRPRRGPGPTSGELWRSPPWGRWSQPPGALTPGGPYNPGMARDPHRPLRDAWIIEAVRTPIGRYGGALASVRPDDLAAAAIRAVVDRSGIDPALIEDVILGCANQAGEDNRNVARMALLLAGLPVEVAGQTVNRLCGSGLQAINSAAHAIQAGDGDVFIGGRRRVDDPRAVRDAQARGRLRPRRRELVDTTLGWRFVNPRLAAMYYPYSMGETAENVAERWTVRRPGAPGRLRAGQPAEGGGRHRGRPVRRPARAGPRAAEEGRSGRRDARRASRAPTRRAEALARLRPAFREGGSVTAGNSSGINDGAAATLVVEANRARGAGLNADGAHRLHGRRRRRPGDHGHRARARARKALARAGHRRRRTSTSSSSTRRSRRNRSCAWTSSASIRRRSTSTAARSRSGIRSARRRALMTMLVHELRRRGGRYGLATMCIGVGQGIATVVERIDDRTSAGTTATRARMKRRRATRYPKGARALSILIVIVAIAHLLFIGWPDPLVKRHVSRDLRHAMRRARSSWAFRGHAWQNCLPCVRLGHRRSSTVWHDPLSSPPKEERTRCSKSSRQEVRPPPSA